MIICVTPLFHLTYIKTVPTETWLVLIYQTGEQLHSFIHITGQMFNTIWSTKWCGWPTKTPFLCSVVFLDVVSFFLHNETINGSSMREWNFVVCKSEFTLYWLRRNKLPVSFDNNGNKWDQLQNVHCTIHTLNITKQIFACHQSESGRNNFCFSTIWF